MRVIALGPLACAAVITAASWVAPAASAAPSSAQARTLNQAQQHYEKGELKQAAETLRELVDSAPGLAEAHRLLGHVYYRMDEPGRARAAFVDAISRGRLTPAMLSRLIRIDRRAGRTQSALAGLELRSILAPEAPDWRRLEARLLNNTGRPDAARRLVQPLVRRRPWDIPARLLLGNSYLRAGRQGQAVREFVTAYHLGGGDAALAETIGQLWQQLSRPEAAAAWYERAIALTPHDKDDKRDRRRGLILRRGKLLVAAELTGRATSHLQTLAASGESQRAAKAALRLGQLARLQGRSKQAIGRFERALELGLDRPDVYETLGAHHYNEGHYQRAADLLEKRLKKGSNNQRLRRFLVQSLIQTRRLAEAREALHGYIARFGLDKPAKQLARNWHRLKVSRSLHPSIPSFPIPRSVFSR